MILSLILDSKLEMSTRTRGDRVVADGVVVSDWLERLFQAYVPLFLHSWQMLDAHFEHAISRNASANHQRVAGFDFQLQSRGPVVRCMRGADGRVVVSCFWLGLEIEVGKGYG